MSAPAAVPETLAEANRADGAFSPTDWLVFVAISGIWGASFLFIAIGLESLEPGVITLLRVGLGALTLAVLPGGRVRIDPSDRVRLVAVSILWVGIPFTLFPLAEQRINSAVTGLLNGATPMFAALFAATLFGRRTSGAQLLGVLVGFGGIVLISLPSLGEGSTEALGVLFVLAATVCYGLATNLVAPLQGRYGSQAVMGKMLALATIWTLPYGLASLDGSHVEAGPIVAVTVLGVVGTALAFLLMGGLVGRVGPTRATFITYCIPPVSLALGVVFQDDHVAALALVGVALAIAGAVLAGRPVATRSPSPAPAPPVLAAVGDEDRA